jgi:hypothetical protein
MEELPKVLQIGCRWPRLLSVHHDLAVPSAILEAVSRENFFLRITMALAIILPLNISTRIPLCLFFI